MKKPKKMHWKTRQKLQREFIDRQPPGSVITKTIKFDTERLAKELKKLKDYERRCNKMNFTCR
jgi:hypothetical protein